MANGRVSMKDSVSRLDDDQNTITAAVMDEVMAILSEITNASNAAFLIKTAMPAFGSSFLNPPGMVKAAVNVNVAKRVDIVSIMSAILRPFSPNSAGISTFISSNRGFSRTSSGFMNL